MIFLFRAAFWTLVVAAFLPAGFYAPADGAFARRAEDVAAATFDSAEIGETRAAAVCEGREALCETAGEFARFAGWAAALAADRAETAYRDFAETRDPSQAEPRSTEDVFAAAASEPVAR